MSAKSKIEWTDATVNFWWGCTKVGPGCDNCYAETLDHRTGGSHWGRDVQRRKIKDGDIVKFVSCTTYGEGTLTMTANGVLMVDKPIPEGAEQCCVLGGWQADTILESVDELIAQFRELIAEEDFRDAMFDVSFYTYSEPIPFEFRAEAHQ